MILDVSELVARARRQDAEAFASLIERFERAALSVAYARLHDADRAGDAVQDGFLRAWQELSRLQDPTRFGAWLMQIVRHAAIDLQRRARKTAAELPEVAAAGPDPAGAAEAHDTASAIQAALRELDETTRSAVVMRYYEGLSARQIAELLDLTPAAVDMRLSRARSQLREQLAPLVDEDSPSPPQAAPRRKAIGESL